MSKTFERFYDRYWAMAFALILLMRNYLITFGFTFVSSVSMIFWLLTTYYFLIKKRYVAAVISAVFTIIYLMIITDTFWDPYLFMVQRYYWLIYGRP